MRLCPGVVGLWVRHMVRPVLVACCALWLGGGGSGCKGRSEDAPPLAPAPAPTPGRARDALVRRRVPDTRLVLGIPKGWLVEMPNPGPLPEPPPANSPVVLQSRTLLTARPGTPVPGTLVAPMLQILEDPWLPVGTTGVDYLVAQRKANLEAIGQNIHHVDAEPSRLLGRPSYHVRDEWSVQGPGGQRREVSQEAVLLLDARSTADGSPALFGYTVVVTLEKVEFETTQPVVRQILASIGFDDNPG